MMLAFWVVPSCGSVGRYFTEKRAVCIYTAVEENIGYRNVGICLQIHTMTPPRGVTLALEQLFYLLVGARTVFLYTYEWKTHSVDGENI